MRTRSIFLSLLLGAALMVAGSALAGDSDLLAPDKPPENVLGPLITDTAVPIGQGNFSIQPLVSLGFRGGEFSPSWRRVSSQGNFYSLQLPVQFTYGPFPNVEMLLVASYFHNWAGDARLPASRGTRDKDFGGLGDTTFYIKYRFQKETALLPTCTGLAGFGFPTGHYHLNPSNLGTDQLGSGAYTFTAGLNLSKWLSPVYLYANLWYAFPMATAGGEHIQGRDRVTLNLAAEWFLTPKWALLLEFYSNWQTWSLWGHHSEQPAQALLGLVVGLEYNLNAQWSFAGGLAIDVAGKNTGYHYSPILTFQYSF